MRLCKGSIDGVTHCCYIEQDLVKSSASLGELDVSAAYIQDIVAGKAMISAKFPPHALLGGAIHLAGLRTIPHNP